MMRLSYLDLKEATAGLAELIPAEKYSSIYAIPRGGLYAGLRLSELLRIPLTGNPLEEQVDSCLIVDDLEDSGSTIKPFLEAGYDTAVIYSKNKPASTYCFETVGQEWLEFPYEQTERDEEDNIVRMLETLGEDVSREGLRDTPKRVMKFYREFLSPEKFNFTTFEGESYDEMIIQKDIPFFSLCEHHLAPFFGTATVAYIPDGKIVGLSKLARTVDLYARRFQNQERITSQIAERLTEELQPRGVAVTLKARHFCMEMRGIKTHDVQTITTKLSGAFRVKPEARAEFLSIANA